MAKCSICNKDIDIRHVKGRSYLTEGRRVCFVPSETSNIKYINSNGSVMFGQECSDGQNGYKLHVCC